MSFYRTYRPQIIDEIDNSQIRSALSNLVNKGIDKIPHAYLFTGSKGSGKTTTARILAKIYNCEKLSTGGPCGICSSCREIAAGSYMDVIEMDAASNRGIEEIRSLKERIMLTPTTGKYTVYIIDEVHMLTTEAFNALLKTLEEPPLHVVFILATTDPHKVPATIKSRCMNLVFNKAGRDEIVNALKRIIDKEHLKFDDEALDLIIRYADGSFRDAVKILEQVSLGQEKISLNAVKSALTVSDVSQIQEFISLLISKDRVGSMKFYLELMARGADPRSLVAECLFYLEEKITKTVLGNDNDNIDIEKMTNIVSLMHEAYLDIKISPVPALPIEIMLLKATIKETVDNHNKAPSEVNSTPSDIKKHIPAPVDSGTLSLDKLKIHWKDIIEEVKPMNHSIAGMLRSAKPRSYDGRKVVIEAFYKFHQEKLSDTKIKTIICEVLNKLFGQKVEMEIILGNK